MAKRIENDSDFKFFCDDELSLSSEQGAFGKYVALTVWEQGEDGKAHNAEGFAFTPRDARDFADWLRRYADKADGIELP